MVPDSPITPVMRLFLSLVLSLRAQFAVENKPINQLHGSGSDEEAGQEISFFFPKQRTLAVIKPDAMEEHGGPFCSFETTHKCLMLLLFWHHLHIIFHPFIRSDRGHCGGDSWQRVLHRTAEGDDAVEGDGWGVLQRAPREAVLQPAGGVHVSVSLPSNTATTADPP